MRNRFVCWSILLQLLYWKQTVTKLNDYGKQVLVPELSFLNNTSIDNFWTRSCGADFVHSTYPGIMLGNGTINIAGTVASKVFEPDELDFEISVRVTSNSSGTTNNTFGDGYALYLVNKSSLSSTCSAEKYFGIVKTPGAGLVMRAQHYRFGLASMMFKQDMDCNQNMYPWKSVMPSAGGYYDAVGYNKTIFADATTYIRLWNGTISMSAVLTGNQAPVKKTVVTIFSNTSAPDIVDLIKSGNAVIAISGGFMTEGYNDRSAVRSVNFYRYVPENETTTTAAQTTTTPKPLPPIVGYATELVDSLSYSSTNTDLPKWALLCGAFNKSDSTISLKNGTMASKKFLMQDDTDFQIEIRMKEDKTKYGDGYAIYIVRNSSLATTTDQNNFGLVIVTSAGLGVRMEMSGGTIFSTIAKKQQDPTWQCATSNNQASCNLGTVKIPNHGLFSDATFIIRLVDGNITIAVNFSDSTTKILVDNASAKELVDVIKTGDCVLAISGGYKTSEVLDDPYVKSVKFVKLVSLVSATATTTALTSTATGSSETTTESPTTFLGSTSIKTSTNGYYVTEVKSALRCGGIINLPNGDVINADGAWNAKLSDPNSDTFKALADFMTPAIIQLYAGFEGATVTITNFRQGSVISDYEVALRSLTALTETQIQQKVVEKLQTLLKASGSSATGGLNWNKVSNSITSVTLVAKPVVAVTTTKKNSTNGNFPSPLIHLLLVILLLIW